MANPAHLDIIVKQGVQAWNERRQKDSDIYRPDLRNANLSGMDLTGIDLSQALLQHSVFTGANLTKASLYEADLTNAIFENAILEETNLRFANLNRTHLKGAHLIRANLSSANIKSVNLEDGKIIGCNVYGVTPWDINLKNTEQKNLIITHENESEVTVDNILYAHYFHLLQNNQNISGLIDSSSDKAVLILGRFTPKRKAILDGIRDNLRKYGYITILFDFEEPKNRDLTETIKLLAHMSKFIIADITEPSSIPKELEAISPTLAIPVQPIIEGSQKPFSMFKDYWKYHWLLKVYSYENKQQLLDSLIKSVIEPAEKKLEELKKSRAIKE